MIPYRRRDGTVFRDLEIASLSRRASASPTAASTSAARAIPIGILADEYLPREQDDACEIIAHLAAQDWCNGNIGMTGISWGGFNSLQVAARRPPALKAIITLVLDR